jgi:quinol monooxygenase YgiN
MGNIPLFLPLTFPPGGPYFPWLQRIPDFESAKSLELFRELDIMPHFTPHFTSHKEPQIQMIHVIAIVTTKRGQRDTVLQAFRANMPAVKAEQGCIEYEPSIDSVPVLKFQTGFGADTFVVIEKWESIEALEAHSTAPHMSAYSAKTRDLIASRVIHVLSPT